MVILMGQDVNYFWTHGVNLIVQNEPDAAASIRRNSLGTRIRQNQGENWFHFGVPTPTKLKDHAIKYKHAYLKGHINGNAWIMSVHIYEGGYTNGVSIATKRRLDLDDLNFSSRPLEELDLNLPDQECNEPMVICIKAKFENGGEIHFAGAGIRFDDVW